MIPIRSSIFSSHYIAGFITLLLFFYILFSNLGKTIKDNKLSEKPYISILLNLALLYLISASISIIGSINIVEFLKVFKNLAFSVLILWLTLNLVHTEKKLKDVVRIIIITIIINFIYQYGYYSKDAFVFPIMSQVIEVNVLRFIQIQSARGRFFIEIHDAALVSIVIFYLLDQKKFFGKLFFLLMTVIIFLFSFLSNFRILILVYLSGFVSTCVFLYRKRLLKSILVLFVILVVTASLGYGISKYTSGYGLLDRLSSADFVTTLMTRYNLWGEAMTMGLSNPITGVGMGNFYDNLTRKDIVSMSFSDPKNDLMRVTDIDPHNIFFSEFATKGFLGLILFGFILFIFLIFDLKYLRKGFNLHTALIISFWSLFIYSLTGPAIDLQYLTLFWLLRGLLTMKPHLLLSGRRRSP